MSGIKNLLFDLMEQDHEMAKRRAEQFGEEELTTKEMVALDPQAYDAPAVEVYDAE